MCLARVIVFFFNPGGGVMKRLYAVPLSTLCIYSFLYPTELLLARRGSMPIVPLVRRSSIIEQLLGGKPPHAVEYHTPAQAPMQRSRTRSAGDVPIKTISRLSCLSHGGLGDESNQKSSSTSSFSSSYETIELSLEETLSISPEEATRLYYQAETFLAKAKSDPTHKDALRRHAEINLEILRRARHKQGTELLLHVYAQDFDKRLSGDISGLEASLVATCGGNSQLLSFLYSLQLHRLQSMADHNQYIRFKKALFSLVGLSESDDFDAQKAKQFKAQITEILRKKEMLQAQQYEIDRTDWSVKAG